MKKLFLFLLIALPVASAHAQMPVQWQISLGGTNVDQAASVVQTPDSGYAVLGITNSTDGDVTGFRGGSDCWLVKLSRTGTMLWQKTYGGTETEQAVALANTFDNGLIMLATTASTDIDVSGNHGSDDMWVVKLSDTGGIQWQKCLGGSSSEHAASIQQTSDSGYIVVGSTSSIDGQVTGFRGGRDYWVVKLSSTGAIVWQHTFGGTRSDDPNSVIQTRDGGYMVAGVTGSNDGDVTLNHGLNDFWLVKLSAAGSLEWQKSLGGSGHDEAYCIRQTFDSGYIVTGETISNDGDVTGYHGSTGNDVWTVKLTAAGAIEWQKCMGSTGADISHAVCQKPDSTYVVLAGTNGAVNGDVTFNHSYAEEFWLIALSQSGSVLWQKCYGGYRADLGNDIELSNDGGVIVVGNSGSSDGDLTYHHGSYMSDDFWVLKLGDTTIESTTTGLTVTSNVAGMHVYPNPASEQFTIVCDAAKAGEMALYNAVGCLTDTYTVSNGKAVIDIHQLPAGLYECVLRTDGGIQRQKISVVH